MGFRCGIVGLPNVGKSTLFNALTETAAAQAANYPFCTIDPNVGIVPMPDPRLDAIANIVKPKVTIPTSMEFVDIAGLVAGASKGEGLGNQFLANIRETFYGRTFDVRAKPNAENVAYTSGYLGLHQDLMYLEPPPMIQVLHCMDNSCAGGESLFSDGDRVGRLARRLPLSARARALNRRPSRSKRASDSTARR